MKKLTIVALLYHLAFASATASAQDRVRIGVPLFPTVSYPVLIAHEKGFFDKNGLKAEIIRINSEPTTYQALISGDIDATSGAPTGLVQSNLQGIPVTSLGSWDNLVSYTVMTKDKIDDLSQLRGKKVGINRLGGKSSLVLARHARRRRSQHIERCDAAAIGRFARTAGGAAARRHRRRAGGFRFRTEDEAARVSLGPEQEDRLL